MGYNSKDLLKTSAHLRGDAKICSYIYHVIRVNNNIKIKVMSEREIYECQQEFNYFEMLVNTKEYVTEDEYNFIVAYDKTEKVNFSFVDNYLGDYLNLNVYSEHDHEKRGYEIEIG
jgi:hypothetical protein